MHDIETNQIAYLRYMFDVSDLEEKMLPYLMEDKMKDKDSYQEIYKEVKEKMPNLILPSMGKFKEEESIEINSGNFISDNKED